MNVFLSQVIREIMLFVMSVRENKCEFVLLVRLPEYVYEPSFTFVVMSFSISSPYKHFACHPLVNLILHITFLFSALQKPLEHRQTKFKLMKCHFEQQLTKSKILWVFMQLLWQNIALNIPKCQCWTCCNKLIRHKTWRSLNKWRPQTFITH